MGNGITRAIALVNNAEIGTKIACLDQTIGLPVQRGGTRGIVGMRLLDSIALSAVHYPVVKRKRKMRIPSLLTLLFVLRPLARAAVLAIDYGAEFTKLSLVKPGAPLDVVLDRDSKRKIQSVVGWKREDRVFGQEGKMAVSVVEVR